MTRLAFLRIFKSFSWAVGSQFLTIISALVFSVIVARNLGPQGVGVFAFYQSLLFLILPVALWGLPLLFQREITNNRTHKKTLMRSVLLTRVTFGVLAFILYIAISSYLRGDIEEVWHVGLPIALILIFKTFAIFVYGFQALRLWKLNFLISLIGFVVLLIASLMTIYLNFGIAGFAWSKFLEAVCLSLACLYFVKYLHMSPSDKSESVQDARSVKYLLRNGISLAITGIIIAGYSRIDQILIAEIMNDEALGIYAIAIQIMTGWWALGGVIVIFLRPLALEDATSEKQLMSTIHASLLLCVCFGIFVILMNIILAKPVVHLFYGPEFEEVYRLLIWLSPTLIMTTFGGVRTSFLIARGHDNIYFLTTIIGLIVTVANNVLLLPKYGLMGAVISLNVSFFLVVVVATFFFTPARGLAKLMVSSLVPIFLGQKSDDIRKLILRLGRA